MKRGKREKLTNKEKIGELISTFLLGVLLTLILLVLKYQFGLLNEDYPLTAFIFLSWIAFMGSILSAFTKLELEFELEFYGVIISGILVGLIAGLMISPQSTNNFQTIASTIIFTLIFGVLTLIKFNQKEVGD